MHEMSVAVSLLERVLEEASRGGLVSVTRVNVELGTLQAIEPDLLTDAFEAAAAGSLAQGAQLLLQLRPGRALCQACGEPFDISYRDFVCPKCGKAEVQILAGKETFLLSLSGESADEGPGA